METADIYTTNKKLPPDLIAIESDDCEPFYVPFIILQNCHIYRFPQTHEKRTTHLIANPKNAKNGNTILTIRKHTDLMRSQGSQACLNNIFALTLLSLQQAPNTSLLLNAYLPPHTDTENDGAYLEEFYTIQALDTRTTLADKLHNLAVLKPSDISSIAAQLLEQILQLKRVGLFHGSIRPDNVAVVRNGSQFHVNLVNFGSCLADEPRSQDLIRWQSKTPELVANVADIGSQSDVYNLGVLILTMLTGKAIIGRVDDLQLLRIMIDYSGVGSGADVQTDKFIREMVAKAPKCETRGAKYIWENIRGLVLDNIGKFVYSAAGAVDQEIFRLVDLACACIQFFPSDRITAEDALAKYFDPLPAIGGLDNGLNSSNIRGLDRDKFTTKSPADDAEEDELVEDICKYIYKIIHHFDSNDMRYSQN